MTSALSWFNRRTAVLATMHGKEAVIAPLLEQQLGVQVVVPSDFDTDRFGTFTRDIDRPGDQRTAARLKAQTALALTGETLAIASEGTFAPHPAFPSIPCNREIVLLLDSESELELVGQTLSTETNYSHQQISSLAEAQNFAAKVGFPTHGLVVIANPDLFELPARGRFELPARGRPSIESAQIIKGIVTETQLQDALAWAFAQAPIAQIETDMRALYNPTRMKTIAQATENLIEIILQTCPQCGCPGFQISEQKLGLRCGLCGSPTDLIRAVIYQCQKCECRQETLFPNGENADPTYCPYCNP
jgi:hypothetical protein